MKLIFTLLLSIVCISTKAQPWSFRLNFDGNDAECLGNEFDTSLFTHPIFNYQNWIYIDTTNHNNRWQIGRPNKTLFNSAFTNFNAIVTDSSLVCKPNDTSVFTLVVDPNWYFGLREFSFFYQLNINPGDSVRLEISTDSGANWVNMLTAPSSPFFSTFRQTPIIKNTTGWDSVDVMINTFSNLAGVYLIRFTLITDSSVTPRDGWMIDDIFLGYEGEGINQVNSIAFNLYPNPAVNAINIVAKENIKNVSISNMLGQEIYTQNYNAKTIHLDVAELPKGVYFIKVNGSGIRQFIKK